MASGYPLFGSKLSYVDYLVAHEFVDDITSATRDGNQRLSVGISQQTREIIASNEALASENIRATEIAAGQITKALEQGFGELSGIMSDGFTQLSYQMQEISSGISELNATFHWGFSQMISNMGRMNDSLEELIKIAKTPAQTAAYEQYEIARDAFRQGLYQECLEALDVAINGNQASTGYKLEWRFHQMRGTIYLGFVGCDTSLIDLAKAEESCLLAARYAKTDCPHDAGRAFLSGGWAAFCQGKMQDALTHTEQALAISPNLSEALFQVAKVKMALGEVDAALPILGKLINKDRFYAIKAASDRDFQRYDNKLRDFLKAIKKEKYQQASQKLREALDKFRFWLENAPEAKNNNAIRKANDFLEHGESKPLIDMLNALHALPKLLDEIERVANAAIFLRHVDTLSIPVSYEVTCPVEKTYQEEVVTKPSGLFRKAVTEIQTKTETIMKAVQKNLVLQRIRFDFLDSLGNSKNSLEFCQIPSGSFTMGDKVCGPAHQVTISSDFYLGTYPITQAQWEAVLGNNPSSFKGADRPVEQVSWNDCQEFIKRLNATSNGTFRLPTEAEWEYACRADSTGDYCFGDNKAQLSEYAWYEASSSIQTQPVGKKKPNAWGLHDMHGNVWEWCQDWYGDYPSRAVTDPQGGASGSKRVCRGGSWGYDAGKAKSAHRHRFAPDGQDSHIGFRLIYAPIEVLS